MKTKIFSTFLFTVLSIGMTYTQSINKPKLDSLFNILGEKNKAMGSIAISKNGTILYSKAIGYRSISRNDKTPATINTKYRIGSISKMFTATMIFQLIEEGKISLTTTLDKYYPNIPNANVITISNILNHRSGIYSFTSDPDYIKWCTQPKTHEEILAIICSKKPVFQPNEKAEYSNSNYVLLGYIIENITKKPYSENLNKKITSKIGLTNTYYAGKTNIANNESYSYSMLADWQQQPETDMSIPGGAGSLVSTPADLTKFIEALFSFKLVSKNSLLQMKAITDGFGMGMFQMPFYDKKGFGHNGGIDGFTSNLVYFPEDSVAIAYCTNGVVYPMNDILIGALSIYFSKDYTIPKFEASKFIPQPEDLDKYPGIYASSQIPLKITITKTGNQLIAQATGQSSFPLEPKEKDKFKFEPAGVVMEFTPDKGEMTLKQGGGNFLFTKEK